MIHISKLDTKRVEKVEDVSAELITSRRVIFTPSVAIKDELAKTSISITCYDKDGKKDWSEIVEVFKKAGWEWSGEWKTFKEYCHVQKAFGHNVKSLLTTPKDAAGYPKI